MVITIKKVFNKTKYNYISNSCDYYAQSQYTYGIGLRNIEIFNSESKKLCSLRQTSRLEKISSLILGVVCPFIPSGKIAKYKLFVEDELLGTLRMKVWSPEVLFTCKDAEYVLYLHPNNYISVMKNGTQIALVQKDIKTIDEQNQYRISYAKSEWENVGFIFLLAAFIDLYFFPQKPKFEMVKYEKTIGFDKYPERTKWIPEEI